MREVPFHAPPSDLNFSQPFERWIVQMLRNLTDASFDNAFEAIADDYTVTNFTETRTLDASTATAGDVADVLCTLIQDMQRRKVKEG